MRSLPCEINLQSRVHARPVENVPEASNAPALVVIPVNGYFSGVVRMTKK